MSDKEKALDALQIIINLTSCHTMDTVNNAIIEQSDVIAKALAKIPAEPITSEIYITCYYIGMTGYSVPISTARVQYKPGDQMCDSCERCL